MAPEGIPDGHRFPRIVGWLRNSAEGLRTQARWFKETGAGDWAEREAAAMDEHAEWLLARMPESQAQARTPSAASAASAPEGIEELANLRLRADRVECPECRGLGDGPACLDQHGEVVYNNCDTCGNTGYVEKETVQAMWAQLHHQPQAGKGIPPSSASPPPSPEGILTLSEARERVRAQADAAEQRRQDARDRDAAPEGTTMGEDAKPAPDAYAALIAQRDAAIARAEESERRADGYGAACAEAEARAASAEKERDTCRESLDYTRHRVLDALGMDHVKGWNHVPGAIGTIREKLAAAEAQAGRMREALTKAEAYLRERLERSTRLGFICSSCGVLNGHAPSPGGYLGDCIMTTIRAALSPTDTGKSGGGEKL